MKGIPSDGVKETVFSQIICGIVKRVTRSLDLVKNATLILTFQSLFIKLFQTKQARIEGEGRFISGFG